MFKHTLSACLLLTCLLVETKIQFIEPIRNKLPGQINRSNSNEFESALPEGDITELKTMWSELLIHDKRYKIGVFCEPIEPTAAQPHPGITQLSPLSYLQDISLYTCDTCEAHEIPEKVDLKCFPNAIKRSQSNMEAVIANLDAVITNQLDIADLGIKSNKHVWFIKETDAPLARAPHKKMHIVSCSESCCRITSIMHEIMHYMEKPRTQIITAEIPVGELVDKMTILEIKTERIDDAQKLENIWRELEALRFTFQESIAMTPELEQLSKELKAANEALWNTEDLIREKEGIKSFDDEFIALARNVYTQNDERCRIKRAINELLGSRLIEEKSYKPYN